ncbi:MAG TPA: FAD-dependent oxidoreductase [Solirubrobacteraceae bacterium]|nr:FAD-dependent oxidoreductase [Solirubrobacteraceae bacterium]
MSRRVLILGAGFGGLELSTMLSEAFGDGVEVTVIDRSDAFVFGYSKLDVMFGRTTPEAVRLPYTNIAMPGVRVLRETITEIDPEARRVRTDAGVHEGDVLVIALGADYDIAGTPGLAEGANEFYSVAGAERLAPLVREFSSGHAVIGVCDAPFKCPPAPSECALLLHDELVARGVRDACRISFVIPLPSPVPPSPETSAALMAEFAARDIEVILGRRVQAIDRSERAAVLDDGSHLPFDLFLGVPRHRAPDVVIAAGITEDGYVPVDSATLRTRFDGVYAVGDVATAGVPKAGVFAEGAGRVVARHLIAQWQGGEEPGPYDGRGSCYVEFGRGRVARVDIDFLSGPERTGVFNAPSAALVAEKEHFGSSRRARWFGL